MDVQPMRRRVTARCRFCNIVAPLTVQVGGAWACSRCAGCVLLHRLYVYAAHLGPPREPAWPVVAAAVMDGCWPCDYCPDAAAVSVQSYPRAERYFHDGYGACRPCSTALAYLRELAVRERSRTPVPRRPMPFPSPGTPRPKRG